jgi:uncharacterized membrane protein
MFFFVFGIIASLNWVDVLVLVGNRFLISRCITLALYITLYAKLWETGLREKIKGVIDTVIY